jgi:hypothetical protein
MLINSSTESSYFSFLQAEEKIFDLSTSKTWHFLFFLWYTQPRYEKSSRWFISWMTTDANKFSCTYCLLIIEFEMSSTDSHVEDLFPKLWHKFWRWFTLWEVGPALRK